MKNFPNTYEQETKDVLDVDDKTTSRARTSGRDSIKQRALTLKIVWHSAGCLATNTTGRKKNREHTEITWSNVLAKKNTQYLRLRREEPSNNMMQ